MYTLLEANLKRKIDIINYLVSTRVVSLSEMSRLLGYDEKTVRKDLLDMRIDLSSTSSVDYFSLIVDINNQSTNLRLLYTIVMNPFKSIEAYLKLCSISRPLFFSKIKYINKTLKKYKCRITLSNGYYVASSSEKNARIFMSLFLFSSRVESFNQDMVLLSEAKPFINYILSGDNINILEEEYLIRFLSTLLCVSIHRQAFKATQISVNTALHAFPDFSDRDVGNLINTLREYIPNVRKVHIAESMLILNKWKSETFSSTSSHAELLKYLSTESLPFLKYENLASLESKIVQLFQMSNFYPFDINPFFPRLNIYCLSYHLKNGRYINHLQSCLKSLPDGMHPYIEKYSLLLIHTLLISISPQYTFTTLKVLSVSNVSRKRAEFTEREYVHLFQSRHILSDFKCIFIEDLYNTLANETFDLVVADFSFASDLGVINIMNSNAYTEINQVIDVCIESQINSKDTASDRG